MDFNIIVNVFLTGGGILINEKIKELRLSLNMSQVELANKIGVTKQCVSNWENANIMPSVDMVITLANFFNVSSDYLLGLSQEDKISLDGLTDIEKGHIKLIIEDLKNK